MNATGIRELYDHHAWATDVVVGRFVESANQLPPDAATLIGRILGHVLVAERYWLFDFSGWARPPWLDDRAATWTPPEVSSRWVVVQSESRAFYGGLGDADLGAHVELHNPIGGGRDTLGNCITHVLLHGAQHRAEAALLLTQNGCSPGEVDFIDYLHWRQARLP